jgi:hypothetical protein
MAVESYTQMRNMVSTAELERRWKTVRLAMKDKGLDFLITQGAHPKYGAYVRWFTDVRTGGNAIITPHIGGAMVDYMQKSTLIFVGNPKRYLRGQTLRNVVDKQKGH